MNKETLNYYKNIKTGDIFKKWETKESYENHSFEFEENWKQVPYSEVPEEEI